MMKKLGLIVMMFLLLVGIVGCNTANQSTSQEANQNTSSDTKEAAAGGNKTIKIGALWPSAGIPPVQSKMKATEEVAKELGVELVNMDAQFDAYTQSQQAKNLIAQKVDGVLVDLIDPQAIVPALKELHEAGIPVVVTTLPVATEGQEYVTSFIGGDNFNAGKLSAQLMQEALGENGGEVAIIEGAPGILVQERTAGFEETIKGTKIKLLETQSSPWDRQKAMDIMQNYLTKYPNLNGVFVQHDSMVPGVVQALKQAGKEGQVKIIGFGATIEGVELMKDGSLYGSVQEDLYWESQEGARVIVDAIKGKEVPKEKLGEQQVITKEKLDNYTSRNY